MLIGNSKWNNEKHWRKPQQFKKQVSIYPALIDNDYNLKVSINLTYFPTSRSLILFTSQQCSWISSLELWTLIIFTTRIIFTYTKSRPFTDRIAERYKKQNISSNNLTRSIGLVYVLGSDDLAARDSAIVKTMIKTRYIAKMNLQIIMTLTMLKHQTRLWLTHGSRHILAAIYVPQL